MLAVTLPICAVPAPIVTDPEIICVDGKFKIEVDPVIVAVVKVTD
jgi:hypothetical protein